MNFNVCLVQVPNYPHVEALAELAELICFGLRDLGHQVSFRRHGIERGARNILLGCHLVDPAMADSLPPGSIAINSEQVADPDMPWQARMFDWARRVEIWDYSERNVAAFAAAVERPVKLLRLGHHPSLHRIPVAPVQDVDVLFYGSVNARRAEIIEAIRAAGINLVHGFGGYGAERDAMIARSKLVLNLHQYESQIFEIVRVSYLMNNAKAVVAEVNPGTQVDPAYLPGICGVPRGDIVAACRRLLDDVEARHELEAAALATLARLPQAELLAPLLA